MIHQIRKIQRFIHSSPKNLFAISLNDNMDNNISLTHNKTDTGIQCSLSNDLEISNCKQDNCLTEQEEDEYNPDLLTAGKRKFNDSLKCVKKAKKVKSVTIPRRSGFTDERFDETSYYFENCLRKVYPYYFTFTTYTKGRWVGRSLLEVFGKEFRAHSSNEYERHIENGSLTVNNERVDPGYILKHNDLLANIVHRHEVPVASDKIDIVHIDNDIVVINKPASIPVHPCGRYRHNTIIFLLAKEYNLKDLKTIHRLDRLTSGILIFARNLKKAQELEALIRDRKVKKQYICRVEGKLPESIECEEPIDVISYKIGVCKVSPKGKQCRTSFQLVGYNEKNNTSVVICIPYSGRMHQIRVHLQFLGYPIKNDPLYNDTIFGPEKGRGGHFGKTDEQLVEDLILAHNAENWLSTTPPLLPEEKSKTMPDKPLQLENKIDHNSQFMLKNMSTQTGIDMPDMQRDKAKFSVDPFCQECKTSYKDPKPKDLIMYLHAFKYSGPEWSYETPMPIWADVNWIEP